MLYESTGGGPANALTPRAAVAIVEPINAWASAPMKDRDGAAGPGVNGGACAGASGAGRAAGAPVAADGEVGIGGAVGAFVGSASTASLPPVFAPVFAPVSSFSNAMYFFLIVR